MLLLPFPFYKKEASGSGRLNNEFKFSQLVSDSFQPNPSPYGLQSPTPPTTHYITQLHKISEENSRVLIYFHHRQICLLQSRQNQF